jgi:hypothetical protein
MDLDDLDIDRLTTVGVLHDVGKVHVDPTILAKPGPLEGEELVRMRRHPEFGFAMTVDLFDRGCPRRFSTITSASMVPATPTVWPGTRSRCWRGSCSWPTPSTPSPATAAYQPALPVEWAVHEIRRCAGAQFDPGVVEAFTAIADAGIVHGIANPPNRLVSNA